MNQQINCVLLVDDDETTNFLNQRLLRKKNIAKTVKIVENGKEALSYLKDTENNPRPDLILLDINMPVMNGWEFLDVYTNLSKELKAAVVIIMLSTSMKESDRERALRYNDVNGFAAKPLNSAKMEALIHQSFPHFF